MENKLDNFFKKIPNTSLTIFTAGNPNVNILLFSPGPIQRAYPTHLRCTHQIAGIYPSIHLFLRAVIKAKLNNGIKQPYRHLPY